MIWNCQHTIDNYALPTIVCVSIANFESSALVDWTPVELLTGTLGLRR